MNTEKELIEESIHECHDCGAKEGELHSEGCDMERCPYCEGQRQLLSCGKHNWDNVKQEDREPYFVHAFSCERCGEFLPTMVMVSDEAWEEICGHTYKKDCVLCAGCMGFIQSKRKELKEGMKNAKGKNKV